jgi:hypothetical protein
MTDKLKKDIYSDVRSALKIGTPVYYSNLRIVEMKGNTVRTEKDSRFFTPWIYAIYFTKSFNETHSDQRKK